jgi:hypothetical protein
MDDSPDSPSSRISIARSAWHWCGEIAALRGRIAAIRELLTALAGLIRDSTPQRRRQHYGDADFDWDHRVNTTSAAVGWRDRLLGVFHSPYQPTESALFHEMIGALSKHPTFDFREFIFIDLGSGKGRTLLMASDYSFRQIMVVTCFAPNSPRKSRQISQPSTAMLRHRSHLRRRNRFFVSSRGHRALSVQSLYGIWAEACDRKSGAQSAAASAIRAGALSQSSAGTGARPKRSAKEDRRDTSIRDVRVEVIARLVSSRRAYRGLRLLCRPSQTEVLHRCALQFCTIATKCYDYCGVKIEDARSARTLSLLSSSMAEHSAVNRRVVGSSPT